ncbi:hypothetical protein BD626DRAFT_412644 [Schizophyllum amplum]|uniref:Chromatin modification-related protein n=1 Tax=Schizophyllum amplum TaxID=97359 RepID=A0A550BX82_9AGAR|nr:hypothetical protein BD626DRAFT_412644 [Auriculariopsis ampla]
MAPRKVLPLETATEAPYALALLSEYTHTLDSLPVDLSRNFADLRELDAVLSSSMASITSKITHLVALLEEPTASRTERLYLLSDIAEEAKRLKLGGEDKIRVACQAADNLKSHMHHLRTLTEHVPGFDARTLIRKTTYPHVNPRRFHPYLHEHGRRRIPRSGLTAMAADPSDASPFKRRAEEHPSPRKDRAAELKRANGRAKTHRAVSPSDTMIDVTDHNPPTSSVRAAGTSTNGARRARPAQQRESVQPPSVRSVQPSAIRPSEPRSVRDDYPLPSSISAQPPARRMSTPPLPANDEEDGHDADPNALYCLCKGPSAGRMIACDNSSCPTEWFHMTCIGLAEEPAEDEKWYCDDCVAKMSKRAPRGGGKRRNGAGRGR